LATGSAEDKGSTMKTAKAPNTRRRLTARQDQAAFRKLGLARLRRRLREIQGKYAWIPSSSEDFIAEKHREIDGER
jgi:hypothetical protein